MGYAVLGVLALAMLFLLFMSFKTWKFFHVFVLFWVFAGSIVCSVYAALVLKTRVAWEQVVEQERAELEKARREQDLLINGNLLEVDQKEPSLKAVKHELRRQSDARGRVWRGCQLTKAAGGTFELNTAPPGPNQIMVNSKLVAFKEDLVPEISDQWKVPVAYLGQFVVTAATETTVTLAPTLQLDPKRDREQIAQRNDQSATWVLYERMPLDSHDVFQGMEVDQIKRALPQDKMQLSDEQYEALIDQYRFDGQPIEKIKQIVEQEPNRINHVFDPPPSQQWVQVKFVQPYQIEVNGEAGGGSPLAANAFDTSGRAQVSGLLQLDPATGEPYPTQFEPGDTGLFDKDTADKLIADGIAELDVPIFVRKLNDYDYSFRQIERQRLSLLSKIAAANRDVNDVKKSIRNVRRQITYREEEITKLKEDLANHQQEIQLVTEHRKKLERDWAATKDKIRKLYYANKHYEAQLALLHQRLAQRIEQATRQTAAVAE